MERLGLPSARAAVALIGLLLALIAPPPAYAGHRNPGDELFIRLEGLPAASTIGGAQLHGCADLACAAPVLLLERGACAGAPCLPGPAVYGAGVYPPYDGARSLSLSLPDDMLQGNPILANPLRRVVVELDGEPYASAPFAPAGPRAYYRAELAEGQIALEPYIEFPPRLASDAGPTLSLILFLLATLIIKPAVAGLTARLRGLPSPYAVASIALPAALISAPLIWGFFPAFSPFATRDDLAMAWLSLAFVAAVGGGAYALAGRGELSPGRVGLLVVGLAPMLCAWLGGAGDLLRSLDLPRLPALSANPWLNLALVTLAVVLVEALLLRRVLRGQLSPRQSLIVVGAANLTCLAVGLALLAPALYA